MRALLTGANGFLGSWLARALAARGDEVRCLVREGSDASSLTEAGFTVVRGDVTEPQTLPRAMEETDVVFHLAGIRRGSTRQAFMTVNAEGTQHVAGAMVQAGARRLVLVSSLAASGPSVGGKPREEADPLCPEEWYGESKAEAERIAFGFSDRLEVTVTRPSRILGPGDHENLTFFKLAHRGVVLKLGGPERRLSVVDVEDSVDQLILQAEKQEAVGEAFFNSSDQTVTLESMMTEIAAIYGVRTRTVYVPELALKSLGAAADLVSNASGRSLPLNRKTARQLLAPGWTCSIEKAKRVLGNQPKHTLQESLTRSANSYLEAGWL